MEFGYSTMPSGVDTQTNKYTHILILKPKQSQETRCTPATGQHMSDLKMVIEKELAIATTV